MRVLVTGGRDFNDPTLVVEAFEWLIGTYGPFDRLVVVHGAAKGLDAIAGAWARRCEWTEEPDPCTDAEWRRYGRSAGNRRNTRMVSKGADICLSFAGHNGTADCTAKARAAGIPVVYVRRDQRGIATFELR